MRQLARLQASRKRLRTPGTLGVWNPPHKQLVPAAAGALLKSAVQLAAPEIPVVGGPHPLINVAKRAGVAAWKAASGYLHGPRKRSRASASEAIEAVHRDLVQKHGLSNRAARRVVGRPSQYRRQYFPHARTWGWKRRTARMPYRSKRRRYYKKTLQSNRRYGGYKNRFIRKGLQAAGCPPPELKWHDVHETTVGPLVVGGTTFPSSDVVPVANTTPGAAQYSLVANIGLGAGPSSRQGSRITIRKINLRCTLIRSELYISNSATNPVSHVPIATLMIVLDKNANGAAPTMSDLIEYTSNGGYSFRDKETIGRYRVLKTWRWKPPLNMVSSWDVAGAHMDSIVPRASKYITWNKDCNIAINFDTDTNDIADLRRKNLFLVAFTTAASATTVPAMNFRLDMCRIRYHDN